IIRVGFHGLVFQVPRMFVRKSILVWAAHQQHRPGDRDHPEDAVVVRAGSVYPGGGIEGWVVLDERIIVQNADADPSGDGFAGLFVHYLAGNDYSLLDRDVGSDRLIPRRIGDTDLAGHIARGEIAQDFEHVRLALSSAAYFITALFIGPRLH